jgi:hypothetical protein
VFDSCQARKNTKGPKGQEGRKELKDKAAPERPLSLRYFPSIQSISLTNDDPKRNLFLNVSR